MKIAYAALLCLPALLSAGFFESYDDNMRQIGDVLWWSSADGTYQVELGGALELNAYTLDNSQFMGWHFGDTSETYHISPRLELTADFWAGEQLYAFLKFRWDDGIHPGLIPAGTTYDQARMDEIFVRYEWESIPLAIQVGRFAPTYGNFLGRHNASDNPFVNYPLLYEQVTSVSDYVAPATPEQFAGRANAPDNPLNWLPVIWGPLYVEGIQLMGQAANWEYAISFINRSASSRSIVWNDHNWEHPTWIARLGYQLPPDWRFGVSTSYGPYMQDQARYAGNPQWQLDPDDYHQATLNFDLAWAHGHWQVWAETNWARFEVPNVGNADIFTWHIEGKRALPHNLYAALRWNQQLYNEIDTAQGKRNWDNDMWRIDAALGWQPAQHLQVKLQYSHAHHDSSTPLSEHMWASQLLVSW